MGKFLYKIARFKMMGSFIGFIFAYLPFLLPFKRIRQSKKAVSFLHPLAAYPDHVLIIPRKIARNIFCLSSEDFIAIVDMAMKIRKKDNRDYVLLINGGSRQDVMQAHFHLFTEYEFEEKEILLKFGRDFQPYDELFWKQTIDNFHDLLQISGVSEQCFSMMIQFKNGTPSMYFI